MNDTNVTEVSLEMPELATDIVHFIILVSTVVGNFLLILSLTLRKEGLKLMADKLMLNTVVCNIMLVLIAIPVELLLQRMDDYPFPNITCKLVDPLSTYLLKRYVKT